MIYFLHGTDIDKARAKARDLITSLQKKKPDAAFFAVTGENFAVVDEYAASQGLFEKKYIVLVDRVCEDKTVREEFVEKVEVMQESENIFIILEGKLDKATVTKIEKASAKTQEFVLEKSDSSNSSKDFFSGDSIFTLADAIGKRDRKQLWVLYRQFIDEGKSPEEIHGTLFWQLKSMMLASRTKTAGESGLAPFVYSKSKTYASNFSEAELTKLLNDLIEVSHDARRGKQDLETRMEVLLLEV